MGDLQYHLEKDEGDVLNMKKFVREKTEAGNVEIVLSMENRLDVTRKWKYTLLMSDIGRLVVIGRVGKHRWG